MVVFLCFGSYILQSNLASRQKISLNALTKLRTESLWKLRSAIIIRSMGLQLIVCHKKEFLSLLFFYKTHANAQQVLPVQTG